MAVSKMDGFRARMGGNVAESMGLNRVAGGGAGGITPQASQADPLEGTERYASARTIEISRIDPDSNQPRKEFDEEDLDNLAASLGEVGQLQTIQVRPAPTPGRFIIITGERRYQASLRAGKRTINAVVKETTDPNEIYEMQLAENLLRSNLKPLEQARAFRNYMTAEGSLYPTATKLASKLKVNEGTISRALALLDLPESVQSLVVAKKADAKNGTDGTISPTLAYEITKAPAEEQAALAERVVNERLTVAETVQVVGQIRENAKRNPAEKGSATKGKPRTKLITSRTFKGQGGYRITVDRAKGIDLAGIAEVFRQVIATIEAEITSE